MALAHAIEIPAEPSNRVRAGALSFNAVAGTRESALQLPIRPPFNLSPGSLPPNTPDPSELFELLAKWDGPYAGGNCLRQQTAAWRLTGAEGAAWLIARSSEETDIELLDRVALTLSEIGQPAIDPILRWVDCSAGSEHLCALFQALAWMDRTQTAESIDAIAAAIDVGLGSDSKDVREKAIAAAGALPYQNAATLLREHLDVERDPTLKALTTQTFRSLGAEC